MGEPDDPSNKHRVRSWATAQATQPLPRTSRDTRPSATTFPPPHTFLSHHSEKHHVLNPDHHASVLAATTSASSSASGPSESHTKEQSEESAALDTIAKASWPARAKAGSWRFLNHTRNAVCHSWINVLLIFVPIGIGINWAPIPGTAKPTVVFAMNAVAIIPLAGLLAHATEAVASRLGDTWASLLNVSFGNAVELIIFIIALAKNEIRIVQASILGSILANLLLILGMSFLLGGLRFQEQIYNSTVTQMSACLLSLSVLSLLLPTAFHASFAETSTADFRTTQISRGTSVVLLLVYILYLLFQLKSHAYMYQSTPQQVIDEESHPGVFADIMNGSSSSSDTDSDGDTDSDTSLGSQSTAKRLKRAWKHRMNRKSSVASTVTGSAASGPSSPASPTAETRDAFDGFSHTTHPMSGDEADTDGEIDRANFAPRVRDFETEHGEKSKSPAKSPERAPRRKKSKKKSKRKQNKLTGDTEASTLVPSTDSATISAESKSRVNFAIEVETINSTTGPYHPKRPFTRRLDSIRSPLPNLLTHTVFSAQPQTHAASPHPVPLSIARSGVGLRRANSLPERFSGVQSSGTTLSHSTSATNAEPLHRPGVLVVNEADAIRKDQEEDGEQPMSRTAAVVLLLVSTGLVAFCAELLVDNIPRMIEDTTVSQAFIGLIILPIVGNAAEHVTAVTVATKNKMDLALGVSLGSSIQIALFVTPFVVLLGWIMDKDMSLYFNLFETVSLFATAFVVNFLVLDGRSNYLEGSLLIAAYVIIAVCAFFYPNEAEQSMLGGNGISG